MALINMGGFSNFVARPSHPDPVTPSNSNYMPNGDVNWLNPPTLTSISPVSVSNGSNVSYSFKTIDLASGDGMYFADCAGVTIENCLITNAGDNGLYFLRCSGITVRNCKITGANQNLADYTGYAIYLSDCGDNVSIWNNWVEDCSGGVYVHICSSQNNYVIRHNFFKNHNRGLTTHDLLVAWSDFMTGFVFSDNVMWADYGSNNVEDHVNIHQSGGVSGDPIMIQNNQIRGGSTSGSGGGILAVDAGKSTNGYITIDGNRLVDPGQYGLSMAGGHNVVITNNDVFSSVNYAGVGVANRAMVIWRQGNDPGTMYDGTVGGLGNENRTLFYGGAYNDPPAIQTPYFPSTGSGGVGDPTSPNHGATVNVDPTGYAYNDWNYSAWDANGGNQGYTDLPVQSEWAHVAP